MSRKLEDLHPLVAQKARELIKAAAARSIEIEITQTLRTKEEQGELYARGRTMPGNIVTNAPGGWSFHNYGLAFDIVILKNGKPVWEDMVDVNFNGLPDYLEVGEMGEDLGLEWGGRWKFTDLPHFQISFGLKIADLATGRKTITPEGQIL